MRADLSLSKALTVLLVMLAGACATAPPSRAPATYSMHALAVCRGMNVTNAPAAAADGRIADYSPMTVLRGVMIARAPVAACLSSGYGPRSGGAGSVHEGVDLYTGAPRAVLAGGDGSVLSVGDLRGYGLTLALDHGAGVVTRYAHLSSVSAGFRGGQRVRAGDVIAMTGESGNATAVHLHYEIRIDGRAVDPLKAGD